MSRLQNAVDGSQVEHANPTTEEGIRKALDRISREAMRAGARESRLEIELERTKARKMLLSKRWERLTEKLRMLEWDKRGGSNVAPG